MMSQQLFSKNSIHILHTKYFVSHSYLLPNILWDIVRKSLCFTESTILFFPIDCFSFIPLAILIFGEEAGGGEKGGIEDCFFLIAFSLI